MPRGSFRRLELFSLKQLGQQRLCKVPLDSHLNFACTCQLPPHIKPMLWPNSRTGGMTVAPSLPRVYFIWVEYLNHSDTAGILEWHLEDWRKWCAVNTRVRSRLKNLSPSEVVSTTDVVSEWSLVIPSRTHDQPPTPVSSNKSTGHYRGYPTFRIYFRATERQRSDGLQGWWSRMRAKMILTHASQ